MSLTRGDLTPATITNLFTGDEVKCHFNPSELTISKTNSWQPKPVTNTDVPKTTFKQGDPQKLDLNLVFDTQLTQSDVRSVTDTLWVMMLVDESKKNPDSGKGIPPLVEFAWGRFTFRAIIKSMTQTYTLFMPDGTPVRCKVKMSLEQILDDSEFRQYLAAGDAPPALPATAEPTMSNMMDSSRNGVA